VPPAQLPHPHWRSLLCWSALSSLCASSGSPANRPSPDCAVGLLSDLRRRLLRGVSFGADIDEARPMIRSRHAGATQPHPTLVSIAGDDYANDGAADCSHADDRPIGFGYKSVGNAQEQAKA